MAPFKALGVCTVVEFYRNKSGDVHSKKKFPMKCYLLNWSVYSQAFDAFALNTEKYLRLRRSKDATRVPSELGLTNFLTAINKLKTLRLTFLCFTDIFLSLSALRFLWSHVSEFL